MTSPRSSPKLPPACRNFVILTQAIPPQMLSVKGRPSSRRPALANTRLEAMNGGRISYHLKRPWADGTTHLVFTPLELIEKLAALVPPPRVHIIRFHGILAPNAKDRKLVVPGNKSPERS